MIPRRLRPAAAVVAGLAGLVLAHASPAMAGTYTVTADTHKDLAGWSEWHSDGFQTCSLRTVTGVCGDGDVPRPTQLRVFGVGDSPPDGDGYWLWTAPPTTTILSGQVAVGYKISAPSTRAYMKARLRNETFTSQPEQHVIHGPDSGTARWSIPAGNEMFAVVLRSAEAHTYADKWNNNLRIDSLTATLRDDTAPALAVSGPLSEGGWHNQAQPVCLTAAATDQGSGVAQISLLDERGLTLDSATATARSAIEPGASSFAPVLCAAPAGLGDGSHRLTVSAIDAAGEHTDVAVVVKVDATAPVAVATSPGTTAERRPAVAFRVDAGPSGLTSFEASVDGHLMTIAGDTASYLPDSDLDFGPHTVIWRAADGAGNIRDGFWTFAVTDQAPPELSAPMPADGWAGEARRPAIGFTVADAGTGVDASTLRVVLDGVDVTAAGSFLNGVYQLVPSADLGFGPHTVRVSASDRAGNAMPPVSWGFTVADLTPPHLGDVRPDPGATGSDRTPVIAATLDDGDGTGIDPSSVRMAVDGVDVSVQAQLSAGRLTYLPTVPLAFGSHTVVVNASDRAGNPAAAVSWTFTVRDETAPTVSGREPVAGTTVPGAVRIAFDVADAGTGIDPSSLVVAVDGSDVSSWGSFAGGHFSYSPGNLGAGVHTIAVTVADAAGNVAGPVMWQFAVADPATLSVRAVSGPSRLVAGTRGTLVFQAASGSTRLAGARLLVSHRPAGSAGYGPARALTASPTGRITLAIAPTATTRYRVVLAGDPTVSVTRLVTVRQRVTLDARPRPLRRGTALRLEGTVHPLHSGGRVAVQMLTRRGWATVAQPRLSRRSAFSAVVVPRIPGQYLFRVLAAATARDAAGASRTVAVRVR